MFKWGFFNFSVPVCCGTLVVNSVSAAVGRAGSAAEERPQSSEAGVHRSTHHQHLQEPHRSGIHQVPRPCCIPTVFPNTNSHFGLNAICVLF